MRVQSSWRSGVAARGLRGAMMSRAMSERRLALLIEQIVDRVIHCDSQLEAALTPISALPHGFLRNPTREVADNASTLDDADVDRVGLIACEVADCFLQPLGEAEGADEVATGAGGEDAQRRRVAPLEAHQCVGYEAGRPVAADREESRCAVGGSLPNQLAQVVTRA